MIEAVLEHFVAELNRIRREQGEEAYQEAAKTAVKMAIGRGPTVEAFFRKALPDQNFDAVRREMEAEAASYQEPKAPEPPKDPEAPPPKPPPVNAEMAKEIMGQIPGCRTQAQFNAMLACFDALRLHVSAIFTGADRTESRKALDQALEAADKATEISNKLRDVPEAATSAAAEEFKRPPVEFTEHDTQRALLSELTTITTRTAFNEWYTTNRARLDQVVSPSLRNALFDLIREKRNALSTDEPS